MSQNNRRISLLGTVLLLACALSCSTACVTSAIVDEVADQSRAKALADAEATLEMNLLAQSGQTTSPIITTDPVTIELALRPALPLRSRGSREPYYSNLEVMILTHKFKSENTFYEISAYGDFTQAYAAAFARYAQKLRLQLPDKCVFSVQTYTGTPGARIQVYGH